ncbi:MAG: S8 family serine peptidase [Bacilli bacterium]|nr:S8 family serine peptidase [Bacilli bacterium]
MRHRFASFLFISILSGAIFPVLKNNNNANVIEGEFAAPGLVAYAASYSSDPTSEPEYSTQNNKTFQYLNLGNTLDYYRGDSVKVGIIDSGINYDHEDFMVNGSTKVKGDSKYYSYSSGWVYYKASQHGYSYIDDSHGHGTNVAATVAAAINSVGGLGLAPNVELYVYKVTNSNNGYEFGAIQLALSDAKSLGLDVINMSFQSYENAVSYNGSSMGASSGCSTILSDYLNAAYNAGITLVGAAGNYNTDEPSYPGSNNHVINVGSLNQTGTDKAGFSNYGSTIDLVAPGYVHVAGRSSDSSYVDTSGTSFSAPLVTAAIALYKQQNPSATPAQIESALYASCDSIDDTYSEYNNWAGHGALNVAKFLGIQEDAPTEVVINNPEIVNEELELEVGDYLDLDWTVNGVGTFDDSVNFYTLSGESNVVSVNSSGRITAIGEGSDYVVIESYADSSVYASVYVTVTSSGGSTPTVSSVTVAPSTLTLTVSNTGNLSATVNGDNNPSQIVTWSSSNTSVATVSALGVVTAVATGTATITATSQLDSSKSGSCTVTVEAAPTSQTLTITRSSFSSSGGYAWYDWSQSTSENVSVSGKAELYTTTTTSMQFNKSNGNKVAAIFNTTAIPGSITKIEATTASGTNRSWNAYVTSTACSSSGSTLTFGSNKTTVGTNVTVSTSSTSLGTSTAGYSYFCLQENVTGASLLSQIKITYTPKSLSNIAVKTAPTKTSYEAGDNFDPTGLVITATYSDNSTRDIAYADASSGFEFSPNTSTELSTSNTSVTIYYGNKSCSQAITVSLAKTLTSITIGSYTTSFVEGDTFSYGGTVTAHFSDSSSTDVTSSAHFTGYNMTSIGNQTVTVSYTYKGTIKTRTYNISVTAGTLSSIAVSGMTTSFIKNHSFSFDGTCTATFANGYQKVVTPTNVTSPDMSTAGNKTITVSYIYNNKTVTTSYEITVSSNRQVIETTTTTGYSVIGTITYPSNTQTISSNTLSIGTSGYTTIESNSIRLGSGSNTGTVTVTSTSSNITKVVVSAKTYGTDTGVTLTVGGTNNTITSSYADYVKEYTTATNSVAIATTASKKRAYIESLTVYETKTTTIETDISSSEDCIGLESFIDTYMHMDYVDNLGYCNDSEHHYYSTAKSAFNGLNNHQRTLFTSNSAYLVEWTRLSTWASKNGDTLNSSSFLAVGKLTYNKIAQGGISTVILIVIGTSTLSIAVAYFLFRKKKQK